MNIFLREKYFNLGSAFFFVGCLVASVYGLTKSQFDYNSLDWSDILLLGLATYRLARMIVLEKVFSLFRYLINKRINTALGMSLNHLITCPWCTGVWVSLFLFDVYAFVPYGKIFIIVLAVAGIASPLVQLSNYLMRINEKLQSESKSSSEK